MTATATLDAALLRAWADGAVAALDAHRGDLDALNVFPVADSDTGTNLYLTLREGRQALAAAGDDAAAAARRLARGTLVGARGNSGVIVSQYLGALLRALPAGPVTGGALARALRRAGDAAYRAVARPVEGTVLSVARAVAEGAERALDGADDEPAPADVLAAALEAGTQALARTPAQLAALRAACVLDAGGWGLLLVLGALAEAMGAPASLARPDEPPAPVLPDDAEAGPHAGGDCHGDHDHDHVLGGGAFEVMYVVDVVDAAEVAEDAVAERLRAGLAEVGDSVAVVGGDGLWQAHVHTDSPLDAVAAARAAGVAASQVRVRHIASQAGVHGAHTPPLGVVAVTGAAGLTADLARAGAVVVLVPPGRVAGPELERAVDDTGAATVLVLAADGLVGGAPDRPGTTVRADLSEVQVVAGTATLAMLAADADADASSLAAGVLAAVDGVVTAEAELGSDGDVAAVLAAATAVAGPETTLLTALAPGGAPDDLAERLAGALGDAVEVVVLDTGLPGARVVLGAETEEVGAP